MVLVILQALRHVETQPSQQVISILEFRIVVLWSTVAPLIKTMVQFPKCFGFIVGKVISYLFWVP